MIAERHSGDVRGLRAGSRPPRAAAALRGRLACLSLALLAALASALALASAPALALSQRGHAFSFSFGSSGRGEDQFQHPSAVAVNNSTSEVYVADRNDNRVEKFKPTLNGKGEVIGEKYAGEFTVPDPVGVAVDNSTEAADPSKGDVYVLGARGIRDEAQLTEEAGELKAEATKEKEQAKTLKEEAGQLSKEAKKLPEPEKKAKEEEASKKEAAAEAFKEGAKERTERAKLDEATGSRGREREEEEEEEIKSEQPEPEYFWIYKFNPTGTAQIFRIRMFHKEGETHEEGESLESTEEREEFEGATQIALNTSGELFVYRDEEHTVESFSNAVKNAAGSQRLLDSAEGQAGFALDSHSNFYAGVEELVGGSELEEELTELIESENRGDGVLEESAQKSPNDVIAKLQGATGNIEIPELDPEYATAVAVNPADEPGDQVPELDDVYLNNVTSVGGQDSTTVAEFNPEGKPIQRFGAPGLKHGDAIAVDSASGAVYVADAQSDEVDVFELESPGPPTVAGLSACTLEAGPGCPAALGATTLSAQVDPSGADTHYEFEYGAGSCAATPDPCTMTPEANIGEAFGDQGASLELPSLSTGTYHYRIVASNRFGTVRSAERTFTILASASALPDGREWEMVTPAAKHGAEAEPMNPAGGEIQASENGNAITYVADGPMGTEPEGSRSPEATQLLSTRGPDGWSTQDITTPDSAARGVLVGGVDVEYQAFSPNLALALVEPFPGGEATGPLAEPPLSPPLSEKERGHQEQTISLRADAPQELLQPDASEAESYEQAKQDGGQMTPANAGYLALVSELNAPGGEPFGGGRGVNTRNTGLQFSLAATPDLSHVVFYSYRAAPGIYEWGPPGSCSGSPLCKGGDVQPVSLLEGKLAPVKPGLFVGGGEEGDDARHAISNNGALVFWSTGLAQEPRHLYVRDTVTQETLQLDTPQPGASGLGLPNAQFQTASADGSKVFFTDVQRLTENSKALSKLSAQIEMPDLYVAELSGGGAPGIPLTVKVTDLTPEGINGESADVQSRQFNEGGGVLGASEDGSYVYFVADGALAPGATRGYCSPGENERPPGTTCSLYVRHYSGGEWTPTKLIGALSTEDSPDWGGSVGVPGALDFVTSRVSPNGRYLAFMSERSLTGYDNEDVTSEEPGERLDEEVFLYDVSSERLVCASCNPSGARPAGVQDTGEEAEGEEEGRSVQEGAGLLVDRIDNWTNGEQWLAGSVPGWTPLGDHAADYQSRYLSDSGRLFFNSPDHLVPAATPSGVKDKVYEYEPDHVGSCGSEAGCVGLISSANGKREAAFLDASASGNDVFFITGERLVQQDEDPNFTVYDAHVCEPSSPCLPPPAGGAPPCKTLEECRPGSFSAPAYQAPASTGAASNVLSFQESKEAPTSIHKPPPPTRAQKLKKALKACKRDKHKSKRVACERQAKKKYGPIKKGAKKSAIGASKSAIERSRG